MKVPARAGGFVRTLSLVPGALLAVLPSAHCPFCLGAYGALVSSLGLGFVLKEAVLAPLIGAFLVAGVVAVAWSTRSHRRAGPLAATVVGSIAVAMGRLVWSLPLLVYGGGAVLLAAALWNLWLKRPGRPALVPIRLGKKGERQ